MTHELRRGPLCVPDKEILSLKARLYRRAGGKKIVVAEGVLREEEPSQFLASDGKLYRWDQDYEGHAAVYFWYRDLPAFEVTSRG